MFFNHKNITKVGGAVSLSSAVFESEFDSSVLEKKFNEVVALSSTEGKAIKKLSLKLNDEFLSEEYDVIIDDDVIITAKTPLGASYALADIKDMILNDTLSACKFHELPETSFRAYRAFLPAREAMDSFVKMLDFITDFKYNTLILEVGGAMEYKRRPKINEKWFEFAKDVHRYSGRSEEIQYAHPWSKNSIHVDNANGEILTQDEVKKIVDIAKSYNLNVIPEIPSLSHSDYICQAYPEIAERVLDPYPDTYCPNNPKSYEVLFDVQDEIIDLFKPNIVHIGHDEIYSLCVCDKCKGLDPVDVYVNDIVKIKNRLDVLGIKTMMWCDRTMESYDKNGNGIGGSYHYAETSRGIITQPALYTCAEKLPKDIILMDWLWDSDVNWRQNEKRLVDLGFNYVYGNLYSDITDWEERCKIGPFGGSVSNWGSFEPVYMQRNLQNVSLAKIAYLLWNKNHKNDGDDELNEKTFDMLFNNAFKDVPKENRLCVLHTCDKDKRYVQFYDGLFIDKDDNLGKYVVEFVNGEIKEFSVDYGYNIGNLNVDVGSRPYLQTIGNARPIRLDGKVWYKTVFDKGSNVEVKSVKFVSNSLNAGVNVQFKIF